MTNHERRLARAIARARDQRAADFVRKVKREVAKERKEVT